MSPWKVILATMVIFGCGVVTGGLLMKTVIPRPGAVAEVVHTTITTNQPPPLSQWQRPEFLRRMEKQLDLTPEQHDEVLLILHDSQNRTRSVWEQISPQLRDEFRRVRTDIRQVLTPEQKKKWDELMRSKPHKGEIPVQRPPRPSLDTNVSTNNL